MKQILFLLLFPCFAMAQYTGNANQKITLGEQTTADGLVYRGVQNDTSLITPLSDTSAYIILDTVNNKFYNYNRSTNVWSLAGGGVSVSSFSAGTTGLTPNTATTGAVTLGGTLAVANGGTGASTLAGANINTGSGTLNFLPKYTATGTTIGNSQIFDNGTNVGIGTNDPTFKLDVGNLSTQIIAQRLLSQSGNAVSRLEFANATSVIANILTTSSGTVLGTGGMVIETKTTHPIVFRINSSGNESGGNEKMRISADGNVGIGSTSPHSTLGIGNSKTLSGTDPISVYTDVRVASAVTGGLIGYNVRMVALAGSYTVANMYGIKTNTAVVQSGVTVTNSYGIYIGRTDDPTSGGVVTNKYALVTEATAGNVGIGTTSPSFKLDVSGTGRFTDAVTISSSSVSSGGSAITAFGFDGVADLYTTRGEIPFNAALYLYNNPISGQGYGTGILFRAKSTTFNSRIQGAIGTSWTTATDATRTSQMLFRTVNAGVESVKLTIEGTGAATFSSLAAAGAPRTVLADANGTLSASSSITIKENVNNLTYGLDKILQLQPKSFQYIDKDKYSDNTDLGFIAEDVFSIVPEATGTMNDGFIYFDAVKLIPILTKAIQEQQALIKALEQRILTLENK